MYVFGGCVAEKNLKASENTDKWCWVLGPLRFRVWGSLSFWFVAGHAFAAGGGGGSGLREQAIASRGPK